MTTVLSSASARPNFVKLSAVDHAIRTTEGLKHVIVHTGQHYDPMLSDIFFTQLMDGRQPDFNLGVKGGADRESMISATEVAMIPVLTKAKPDIVLVYGDVNGAVGAARAAKHLGIRVGHVEAGLRSFDSAMPEEHNRIEIDKLADDLFITEASAEKHLKEEGVPGKIHFVGNTMIDTLVRMKPMIDKVKLDLKLPKKFAVATIHRPSNVDDPATLTELLEFLTEIADRMPLVLPLHKRTYAAMLKNNLFPVVARHPALMIVEPLGYLEFLNLASHAEFIVTDSGGIQEEATFLKKRCFTLRKNTERPSTVESGSNVLIDFRKDADAESVLAFAKSPTKIDVKIPKFWDGKAGERIAEALLK